ncbi:cytochrome P450 [Mycena vitilis]|nr:cytochrome P450 [Mycena vitilis]
MLEVKHCGTTSSYLQSLILALVAYPDAQKKAHEEIDRVVGEHRMPSLKDLEHMPYIRGVILETHRSRPVAPIYLPHRNLNAEEYKGFVIPQGTTIFVNVWGIFHDPELFEDPENFVPDRYVLTENGTKPGVDGGDYEFALNINAMNLLWAFNFAPETDTAGNPIEVDTFAYHKGVLTAPIPFRCKITPRSLAKAETIRHEFLEAENTFTRFEFGLSPEDKEYVEISRTQAAC